MTALAGLDGSEAASSSVISGSLTLDSGHGPPLGGCFVKLLIIIISVPSSAHSFSERWLSTCFVRLWVQREDKTDVTPDLQTRGRYTVCK